MPDRHRSPERELFLADIIITALEGGINYWSEVSQYGHHHREDAVPPRDAYAVIHEIEPSGAPNSLPVNIEVIARGISKIRSEQDLVSARLSYSIRMGDETNDAGFLDADAADAIVQVGLFGEVVYG